MIYKKYIIEISNQIMVLNDVWFNNNRITTELSKSRSTTTDICYLDNLGITTTYPYKYYTYEDALYYLDKYYYNISNVYNSVIKISEVYDNIPYPLLVERKIKINKLKCLRKRLKENG